MRVSQRGTPSEAVRGHEGVLRLRGSGAPQPRREPRPGERSAWGRMLNSALGVLRRTGLLRKQELAEPLTKSAGKRPAGGAWDAREAGEQAKRKRQWEVSHGDNPGANIWFLESTPIQMLPESGSICGRLT